MLRTAVMSFVMMLSVSSAAQDVSRARCEAEHGAEAEEIDSCVSWEQEALTEYKMIVEKVGQQPWFGSLDELCRVETEDAFGTDESQRLDCLKNEMAARLKLLKHSNDDVRITEHCRRKRGEHYSEVVSCMRDAAEEKRMRAKRSGTLVLPEGGNGSLGRCKEEADGDDQLLQDCLAEAEKEEARYAALAKEYAKAKWFVEAEPSCRSQWEDSFGVNPSMLVYCLKQQYGAYRLVELEARTEPRTVAQCRETWAGDYQMLANCVSDQLLAKLLLKQRHAQSKKRPACQKEWGSDYKKVLSCVERS